MMTGPARMGDPAMKPQASHDGTRSSSPSPAPAKPTATEPTPEQRAVSAAISRAIVAELRELKASSARADEQAAEHATEAPQRS